MAEQEADRGGERQRRERPERRRPSNPGNHRLPPQREVDQAEQRDEAAGHSRQPSSAWRETPRRLPRDPRYSEARDERGNRHRHAEEAGEIDRHDECVARAGDEAWHPCAEAKRRGWTQQERRNGADAQAREERDCRRAARRACRSENEPIHARVEVTERAQALPQFVDARVVARWGRHGGQILRAATNADSSRSRSARGPNGASARSAV